MATHTRNRKPPMTGIPHRAGLFLEASELAGTPDVVLSVFLSTIQEAMHLARLANNIATWFDLVKLEAVVGDEMRDRANAFAELQAERERIWDEECKGVVVGPSVFVSLETALRDASDLGVA